MYRFEENIFDTRETEDILQKTTCAEDSEFAQFVKNILDLEETEVKPEKITCYPNFVHFVAFFEIGAQIILCKANFMSIQSHL